LSRQTANHNEIRLLCYFQVLDLFFHDFDTVRRGPGPYVPLVLSPFHRYVSPGSCRYLVAFFFGKRVRKRGAGCCHYPATEKFLPGPKWPIAALVMCAARNPAILAAMFIVVALDADHNAAYPTILR